jgi:hypothetical protein
MYRLNKANTEYVLVIPRKLRENIDKNGNIVATSVYNGWVLKKLFFLPENIAYLRDELAQVLINKKYVEDKLLPDSKYSADFIISKFKENLYKIFYTINTAVENYPIPKFEDLQYDMPILQLSELNKNFINTVSLTYINNPSTLVPDFDRIDPDTLVEKFGQYDYDSSSWVNGWKPEDLFLNNAENRKSPYWTPYSVNLDGSGNDKTGVNNIYDRPIYGNRGRFPYWQVTPQHRHYDRDNQDMTYNYGGIADNAVQTTRGYDMTSLRTKPTY